VRAGAPPARYKDRWVKRRKNVLYVEEERTSSGPRDGWLIDGIPSFLFTEIRTRKDDIIVCLLDWIESGFLGWR
jgi:hypothetical protein